MTTHHPSMAEVLSGPRQYSRPGVHEGPAQSRSVVALSRLPGSRGDEVARSVADELGLRLYDREILRCIAESAHVPESAVADVDERDRSGLTDWLSAVTLTSYLSPYTYREHLERLVSAIARTGGAVIVGRGVHLLLEPPAQALRVLVVAPLPFRVRTVAQQESVDLADAERRVRLQEHERRAFLRQHFHAKLIEPVAFDLVLNTSVLGVQGAAAAVVATVRWKDGQQATAQAH